MMKLERVLSQVKDICIFWVENKAFFLIAIEIDQDIDIIVAEALSTMPFTKKT